jgi:endonuclease-3
MEVKEFLDVVDILQRQIPKDSPSNMLKNSFNRTPYTILMATLLSLRTKDENTAKVCSKLFLIAKTPQEMLDIELSALEEIVKPTGMYRKKSETLKSVSNELIQRFNSKVPSTKKELLSLKGVGEKTANIVLNNAFNIPTIAVDTHLHRIPNLLNFINTKNEKDTLKELERLIPKEYWSTLNFTIVSFGQTICLPRNPKCEVCPIYHYCKNG